MAVAFKRVWRPVVAAVDNFVNICHMIAMFFENVEDNAQDGLLIP